MNFATEDVAAGIIRDRAKSGASLADVDPMNIDRSVGSIQSYLWQLNSIHYSVLRTIFVIQLMMIIFKTCKRLS